MFALCIRHADGFTFSFALMQKNKVTKRKNQGYVSGPTPERPFWHWKMNSLRFTTLRQHFSAPPVHSSAYAPPPRPFHYTPRRFAVGFCLGFASPSAFASCVFIKQNYEIFLYSVLFVVYFYWRKLLFWNFIVWWLKSYFECKGVFLSSDER